jgi:hypothetical protein
MKHITCDQIKTGEYYLIYDMMSVPSRAFPFAYKGILLAICDGEVINILSRIGIRTAIDMEDGYKQNRSIITEVFNNKVSISAIESATDLFELSEDEVNQNIILEGI